MVRRIFLRIILPVLGIFSVTVQAPAVSDPESVTLEIRMEVNREVYQWTDFGEPPQLAVWLENAATGAVRTIWVTRRSGRRLWKGKFECPTALPIWESAHQNERSDYRQRRVLQRLLDAFTGATPTGGDFAVRATVEDKTRWLCYAEVNLSGDFNRYFPYRHPDGTPDAEGNGQPSLVYRGRITAVPGQTVSLRLIGRSDQWVPVSRIIPDLTGITTAADAVTGLRVTCFR